MNNKANKKFYSRVLSSITIAALLMAMSVTGALGGFWRTLDTVTSEGVPNPMEFLFGLGIDESGVAQYGYGYGYGYGNIDDGEGGRYPDGSLIGGSSSSSSSSSSGGGGGSSSGGGGSSSGGFTGSSSSSNGGTSTDLDGYLAQLQAIKDALDAAEQSGQTPAPGLQLPSILPQTGKSVAEKGIKIVTHPSVETAFPTWLKPSALATAPTDATYWINTIPYEQDRNASSYVVIPTSGVVAPINASTAAEAAKAISGKTYDYHTPLTAGANHYPGTQTPGENGTAVLLGHSSDYKASAGRYKTIFGKIIELDAGEEIWIYTKTESGSYDRMRFVVETSKEIAPTDTSILLPKSGKNLALFTCTPIGGISGRWYVNAKLVSDSTPVFEMPYINSTYKYRINIAMRKFEAKISSRTQEDRETILATVAYRIAKLEAKYPDNKTALNILAYIRIKLAMML